MRLKILRPNGKTRTIELDTSTALRLGSSKLADVVLGGPGVEQLHCGIMWHGEHFELLASRTAKTVEYNGEQVASAMLRDGDRFKIGGYEITVVEAPATTPAAPAVDRPKSPAAPTTAADEEELTLAPLDDEPKTKPAAGKPSAAAAGSKASAALDEELALAPRDEEAKTKEAAPTGPKKLAAKPARLQAADDEDLVLAPLEAATVSPLDSPLSKPAPGKTVAKTERPGFAGRLARSRGLWTALCGLAAAALVAGAVDWQARQPTSDQIFDAAERDYESGALSQAAEEFAAFAARYPRHARADDARSRAVLARLRSLAAGGNWAVALDTARQTLAASDVFVCHGEQRRTLADVLVKMTAGLVEQAQAAVSERTSEAQAALDRAGEAIALCHRYLRPSLRADTGIDQSELAVTRLMRDHARSTALADALSRLSAGDSSAGDGPFQLRRELLLRYPELAADADVARAMVATAAVQLARVSHQALDQAAETTEPDSLLVASLTIALRSGTPPAMDSGDTCCTWNEAEGAVYGFRVADGKLIWRRFIGFDAPLAPLALPAPYAGDVLLIDSARHELVRLQSAGGRLVWRALLPALPHGAVLLADQVLVPCRNGDLARIDLATGTLRSKFTLPQPLTTAPAVDAERGLIFQPADFGYLYVLAAAEGKCIAVVYLGHEPGTIAVPPLLVGRRLVIAENGGLRDATLRVLETDERGLALQVVQSLPLAAHVLTPAVVAGDRLCIATLGGGLHSWTIATPAADQPLAAGPAIAPRRDVAAAPWLTVVDNQLWMGGAGLSAFDLTATDTLAPRPLLTPADIVVQPLQPYENRLLVCARRSPSWDGLTVAALDRAGETEVWRTSLAAPLAGPPVIDRTSGSIVLAHRNGAVFQRSLDDLAGPQTLDEPASRIEMPRPLPPDTRAIAWDDGLIVFAPGGTYPDGADQLLVFDAAQQPAAHRFALPAKLTCTPITWGPHLLVATAEAQVYLLDPRTGLAAGEPFQPRLVPGRLPRWEALLPLGDGAVLLCDRQGPAFRLTPSSGGRPGLLAEAVESSQLPCIKASGFLGGPWLLGQRWLAADDERRLLCFDRPKATEPAWKMPLAHGLPVGAAVEDDRLIFTSATGDVWSSAAADGKELWAVPIGQPLVGDPVPSKRGWLLTGRDGTLLVLAPPQPNLAARPHHP